MTWFRKTEGTHWIRSQQDAEHLVKNFLKEKPRTDCGGKGTSDEHFVGAKMLIAIVASEEGAPMLDHMELREVCRFDI